MIEPHADCIAFRRCLAEHWPRVLHCLAIAKCPRRTRKPKPDVELVGRVYVNRLLISIVTAMAVFFISSVFTCCSRRLAQSSAGVEVKFEIWT